MGNQSSASSRLAHLYVMSGLLAGWDWFDNGLQTALSERGMPTLNKTQSMMMMYISAGVHRPVEIARKMRLSRAAVRHMSEQLAKFGLVEIKDHPDDKRGKLIDFHEDTEWIRQRAVEIIYGLEEELTSRIGAEDVATLRRILREDWGNSVSGMELEGDTAPKRRKSR
ncbi:MarR family winged helix-turn-helix transcriptional regulator [Henriciella aquimarina]|uniref:MarR family winged helix-turn-helix transcriptional regulator n=1 Tax=Henriciella aquimarina TaxID=545261 RepID=UPI000A06E652|nr:MarR family transcriptional regulator [Henriciella aquimarina]